MAKRSGRSGGYGGFGGGGMNPNMANMMRQVQQMQATAQTKLGELEEKEYEASVGGGAVSVKMNGKEEILSVTISPDACDPDDVETLQDMITAAFTQVLTSISDEKDAVMGSLTGGIPGLGF